MKRTLARIALALALGASGPTSAEAAEKPTIVLVHGAWADASSWDGVTRKLQAAGFTVLAPPNTLRGVAADAAYLRSFLATVLGPVVLVGHSYGGMVISAAAANDAAVSALVYVDAYVPDAGDTVLGLTSLRPGSRLEPQRFDPVPFATAGGGDADLYLTEDGYENVFASDLSKARADVLFAAQRPLANGALHEAALAAESWKTIPSWYVIGDLDRVIPPPVQLLMAQRAKSTVVHVAAAHPSMISHPDDVADVIARAAASTASRR